MRGKNKSPAVFSASGMGSLSFFSAAGDARLIFHTWLWVSICSWVVPGCDAGVRLGGVRGSRGARAKKQNAENRCVV